MGDPPEVSPLERPGVQFVTDTWDTRLALYHQKRHQDRAECEQQRKRLIRQEAEKGAACRVELHYSWECLKRVQQARDAGRKVAVHSVLLQSAAPEELLDTATGITPEVYAVDPQAFASYFQSKSAGMATLACSFAVVFPVSRPLATLRPPLVVLDGLDNPRNIGQILRTAVHLGVNSVVATDTAWECLNGRAARSSMGWLYHVDFHLTSSIKEALDDLRGLGIRSYVAENQFNNPVKPHTPAGDNRWALIVGSEGTGVSATARRSCDERVCVPQRGGESLNVAQATAICLYELGRHMDL